MCQQLIYHRLYRAGRKDIFNIMFLKIRYTDCTNFSGFIGVL